MLQPYLQYLDTQCNVPPPCVCFPTAQASLFYLHPHPAHLENSLFCKTQVRCYLLSFKPSLTSR